MTAIDFSKNESGLSNPVEFSVNLSIDNKLIVPEDFKFSRVYPNPFNPKTSIDFSLPEGSNLKVMVYDIKGRLVETLINQYYMPGIHQIVWDASSNSVPSGIYFIALNTGKNRILQKVMLIK